MSNEKLSPFKFQMGKSQNESSFLSPFKGDNRKIHVSTRNQRANNYYSFRSVQRVQLNDSLAQLHQNSTRNNADQQLSAARSFQLPTSSTSKMDYEGTSDKRGKVTLKPIRQHTEHKMYKNIE